MKRLIIFLTFTALFLTIGLFVKPDKVEASTVDLMGGFPTTIKRGQDTNIGFTTLAVDVPQVTYSVSGFPAGVATSFSPSSCTVGAGVTRMCTTTLTVSVANVALLGKYRITVTADSGRPGGVILRDFDSQSQDIYIADYSLTLDKTVLEGYLGYTDSISFTFNLDVGEPITNKQIKIDSVTGLPNGTTIAYDTSELARYVNKPIRMDLTFPDSAGLGVYTIKVVVKQNFYYLELSKTFTLNLNRLECWVWQKYEYDEDGNLVYDLYGNPVTVVPRTLILIETARGPHGDSTPQCSRFFLALAFDRY